MDKGIIPLKVCRYEGDRESLGEFESSPNAGVMSVRRFVMLSDEDRKRIEVEERARLEEERERERIRNELAAEETRKRKEEDAKRSRPGKIVAATFVCFMLGLCTFAANQPSSGGGGGAEATSFSGASSAYYAGQEIIRKRLRAPKGVEFPRFIDEKNVRWSEIGPSKWHIEANFLAPNAFGTLVRSRFSYDVEDVGNGKYRYTNVIVE